MTRAQMLLLALVLMHILLGALCLALSHSQRDSRALRFWGAGLLLYALGAFVTVLGGILPLGLKQVMGNSLVALSAVVTTTGLLYYTRCRLNTRLTLAGWAIVVVVLAVNHSRSPLYIIDVGVPTIFATLLYLYAAIAMLGASLPNARNAARFVGLALIVVVAVWNTRFAAVWLSAGSAPDASAADLALSIFAIAQLMTAVAVTFGLLWIEVRLMEADLERAALSDWLTGLQNRRAMHARFEEGLSRARRHREPFALITLDVDHFKRVNDRFGHLAGDLVLQEIASTIEQAKRTEDQLGRHGGEEFLLLLPNQDSAAASQIAERLRVQVGNLVAEHDGHEISVTISAGVAAYPDDGETWDELFGAADRRLYKAKNAGRNRVEFRD